MSGQTDAQTQRKIDNFSVALAALKLEIINDEKLWLDALEDRNLASHMYRQDVAESLVARMTKYLSA
jgi:hypothetical protein